MKEIEIHSDKRKKLFLNQLLKDLESGITYTKRTVEKLANTYGITDRTKVKEYTELSIVYKARSIVLSSLPIEEKYWQIVALYTKQVNLSHRTNGFNRIYIKYSQT